MVVNAPSGSGARLAAFVAAIHLVLESSLSLVALFLSFAGFAVVAKIGCYAMGPAVGDLVALGISALRDEVGCIGGVAWTTAWRAEFCHHGLEKILDVTGCECSIGLWRSRRDIGVPIFIMSLLCRIMLVDGHVIYELFEFLVDNVGDGGDMVGRVASTFAGELIFHSIFMFCSHVGAEKRVSFIGRWFGSPNF
jgi:hypothetical protein